MIYWTGRFLFSFVPAYLILCAIFVDRVPNMTFLNIGIVVGTINLAVIFGAYMERKFFIKR